MNQPPVSNSGIASTQKRVLCWTLAAFIPAAVLLCWLAFRDSRGPVVKPDQTSHINSASSPEAVSEPDAIEFTTSTNLTAPPVPPLPDIYISDLKPLRYSSGWGQSGVNKTVVGKPLNIGGKTYEHGLGTHANGEAIFTIPAGARRFVAVVGLDDEVLYDEWGRGSVCFDVYGDVNEPGVPPTLLAKSPVLSPKTIRHWAFNVELNSRFKAIELIVSDAGDGAECDHADWVNAGFLK